ncbi:MAG: GNAT family N-acetyltransferase [Candidatus Melainabacteria bacterium]|nr:GNAT family N-acetyltransferase [Candidatus Melainabacteria bacterium]
MQSSKVTKDIKKIKIRKAQEDDIESLFSLIDALADYEKLQRPDLKARERLRNDLFGALPKISAWLSELDGKAVAYAITLFTYSSFLALPNLYLEDIFVLPEYRSLGIGKELFKHCAKIALKEGCGRMEWQVLDWNKLAIDFYKQIGAKQLKEWLPYRFTKNEIEKFIQLNS